MFVRTLAAMLILASPAWAQKKKGGTEPKKSDGKTTVTPSPVNADWWKKRHAAIVEKSKEGGVQVAFIGDSITQGWEGNGKEAWAKYFEPLKAANYGFGGDQTQHVLWRITEGKELAGVRPKVAVLMIGTNNIQAHSAADIADGVEAIVKSLRSQKRCKVLLLAVFPRTTKWNPSVDKVSAKELQPKVDEVNKIISKLDDGKNIFYVDLAPKFCNADGSLSKEVMYDYLHLSPKGYDIWAKAIDAKVKELLK